MNERNKQLLLELNEILPKSKDNKYNVLIIDDEPPNLRGFKAAFRREHNVFTAMNKDQALDVVTNNKIDYIFCDYQMPINNGADILREIVGMFPNIKRCILTAYSDLNIVNEFKEKTNTTDIIIKPYSRYEVLTRII